MFFPGARVALLGEPFEDAPAGDRAIGAHVVGIGIIYPSEHGTPDFHRIGIELALDPPRAVVAGTALDRVDCRIGHLLQQLARFLTDVLDTRVTWNVIADLAERGREIAFQQSVLVAKY